MKVQLMKNFMLPKIISLCGAGQWGTGSYQELLERMSATSINDIIKAIKSDCLLRT
jgi:hypothetical protein